MATVDERALADAQGGLRALVERDLDAFFASLDLDRPERARDELLDFLPILIAEHGERAAGIAADYYEEIRFTAGVAGAYRVVLRDSPYADAVVPSTRRVAGSLFGETPLETLVGLKSFATKYALAAGRETVTWNSLNDADASGYKRVTRGATCAFCRALAARGAVYMRSTAFFAAHGHCDCAAVPSFDPNAEEVPVDAYQASVRTTNMSDEQKRIHNERLSSWISSLE